MCEPTVFKNITPERWRELDKLCDTPMVFEIGGEKYHIAGRDIRWCYDEASQTLTVDLLYKPFPGQCRLVDLKIREAVLNTK
jgi:hypothetical protein